MENPSKWKKVNFFQDKKENFVNKKVFKNDEENNSQKGPDVSSDEIMQFNPNELEFEKPLSISQSAVSSANQIAQLKMKATVNSKENYNEILEMEKKMGIGMEKKHFDIFDDANQER